MAEPFLSEIKIVGFNFAPPGWAMCDGQILPINQNQSLYSLLGTMYGGDGRTTFALPDLRGRAPVHAGSTLGSQGARSGVETVALTSAQVPAHTHSVKASSDAATSNNPTGRVLAQVQGGDTYAALSSPVDMATAAVASAGAGQGHDNMQPYFVVNFLIALAGIFPS